MTTTLKTATALIALSLTTVATVASARSVLSKHPRHFAQQEMAFNPGVDFALKGAALGTTQAPAPTDQPASLAGSSVATFSGDVLVVDADSGKLIRTGSSGELVSSMSIGRGAAQLVVDAKHARAFVTDRSGDRVVVVDLSKSDLRQTDAFSTKAEPFGIALTPDGSTVLVTTVADTNLTAYETSSGLESWSLELGPEPRGVAVSPSGDEALVTFLTTGVVGRVDLSKPAKADISYVSLDPATPSAEVARVQNGTSGTAVANPDEGRTFARNAFAAIYTGDDLAVVPHQLSTPQLAGAGINEFEGGGGYGGGSGFTAPISHTLAFLGMPDAEGSVKTAAASTNLHQPRALAYDGQSDTLFVAAYGSDEIMALGNVSQKSVHMAWKKPIASGGKACGPTGLAVDPGDGSVVAFCSLDRTTVRISVDEKGKPESSMVRTPELAKSHMSASAQRGQEVFRRGNSTQVSTGGAMACASCHAEGRADSLTWFLQGNVLQTPLLVGRVAGSHPFKWDGKDHNLNASLTNTVGRLGGSGLTKKEVRDLAAFLSSTEAPRTPTVEDTAVVARGKALFESDETGCADCHYGALLTDQKRHEIAADIPAVDTPSLIGLATSAPYYHDGSAMTLTALLQGKGNIHGMGRMSKLDEQQVGDLVAYMKSL